MRTFILRELHGRHLWGVERTDAALTVRWAEPGGAVDTLVRRLADAATALRVEQGLVARRLAEGYRECEPEEFPTPAPRDVMESALTEDPDDLAMHRAYADYLVEQGDPRGEYIQVQLAIDELPQDSDRRQPLLRREEELFREHGRAWLGGLAPFLLVEDDDPRPFRFGKGWLEAVTISRLTTSLAEVMASESRLRLLNTLTIEDFARSRREEPLRTLLQSPYLGNVRSLEINHYKRMRIPRNVVLDPFALPRLTHLRLQGGTNGDDFCTALVSSGALGRLQSLELRRMGITDAGARVLAGCPDLKRLEWLALHNNRLTANGLQLLRNTGVDVRVEVPRSVPRIRTRGDDPFDGDME